MHNITFFKKHIQTNAFMFYKTQAIQDSILQQQYEPREINTNKNENMQQQQHELTISTSIPQVGCCHCPLNHFCD